MNVISLTEEEEEECMRGIARRSKRGQISVSGECTNERVRERGAMHACINALLSSLSFSPAAVDRPTRAGPNICGWEGSKEGHLHLSDSRERERERERNILSTDI